MGTPLPSSIFGQRPKPKRCELKMKILALALPHRHRVPLGAGHIAMPAHHVHHFLLRCPHRKGGDGAGEPHGREGQGGAGVVAHQLFDGLAPANEARDLGELQPRQRDGHHRRGRVLFAHAFGQPVKLSDVPPAALEGHADVPARGEGTAERRPAQKLVYRIIALPCGKHGQMVQLHSRRRQNGRTERHLQHALGVAEAADLQGGGRPIECPNCCGNGGLGQMEGKHRHEFFAT